MGEPGWGPVREAAPASSAKWSATNPVEAVVGAGQKLPVARDSAEEHFARSGLKQKAPLQVRDRA